MKSKNTTTKTTKKPAAKQAPAKKATPRYHIYMTEEARAAVAKIRSFTGKTGKEIVSTLVIEEAKKYKGKPKSVKKSVGLKK